MPTMFNALFELINIEARYQIFIEDSERTIERKAFYYIWYLDGGDLIR